jgi:molybdopterin-guanine dinucleotide biosynthesis protein A
MVVPLSAIGALVLAGGRSSRLGRDKALVRVDGQPLVAWLSARLAQVLSPVVVVVDRPARYALAVPQVTDAYSGLGPLGGLATGLEALDAPAAFACACDMPLLRPALVELLCAELDGYDVAVPERAGRLEPLCAVYARSCLSAALRLLQQRQLRVGGLAEAVHARVLKEEEWRAADPEGDSFLNVNTAADLAALRERARGYGLTLE